jgi:hypothetical protein
MKRPVLIALLALAILALGVSPAAAKRVSCSGPVTVRALPVAQSTDQGALQLYYVERCGQRVSPLFG